MQSDVRAVLQYIPSFRGNIFVVVLNGGQMTELALAEALLDLSALLQIGVRVVVISTGNGEAEISQRLRPILARQYLRRFVSRRI